MTLACGDCCRADCFVQKGARCVSLAFFEFHPALMGFFPTLLRDIHTQLCHTPSFTHNISHALFHTQLSHTSSFFVTQHLSYTTLSSTIFCPCRSSITSFVFPSFPVPPTTFVDHFWKKLTCGVIRSFYFLLPSK